jgi:plasmid stabilization system protein ParE
MTELILLLQADLDIQTAFGRYEEYQAGRGEVFMRQLDAAFMLLREHPEIAPVYKGPYRRMLLRNFPYGIFYQAQPKRIVIAAILDLRQNPASLQRRLFGNEPEEPPERNK